MYLHLNFNQKKIRKFHKAMDIAFEEKEFVSNEFTYPNCKWGACGQKISITDGSKDDDYSMMH